MFKRKAMTVLVGLMILARPGFSTVNSVAGLANPLDNGGGGARALGMGSAFVGVADDSSALLWNPAGLAGQQNAEVALHHNSWLAGIVQETLVLGLPMGSLGGFGFSANYVNYGAFTGYDSSGSQLSDYSPNRYGFGLGWGKEVLTDLSAGVSVKGSMQTIDSSSYSALSFDLGAIWSPVKNVRLGLAYDNLGTTVAGYSLASALRVGGSEILTIDKSNQLLLAVSGSLEPQGVSRVQLGAEDVINTFLALRAGYQLNLADNQIHDLTSLSAGAGFLLKGFKLDYAFLPFGDIGISHRISLTYQFGGVQ